MDEYIKSKVEAINVSLKSEKSSIYKEAYDKLVTLIVESIARKGITFENVIIIIIKTMEVVEQIRRDGKALTGQEKSDLASDLVVHIVKDLVERNRIKPEVAKVIFELFDSPIGSTLIFGIATLASKGKILINEFVEKIKNKCC